MTEVAVGINPEFNEPVPFGSIHLAFVTRSKMWNNHRSLIVGFHLGEDPEGRMILCSEDELLKFPKFQHRALSKSGVFVNHPAASGTPSTKKKWNDEILAAMQAGQTVDVKSSGFRLIGGWH